MATKSQWAAHIDKLVSDARELQADFTREERERMVARLDAAILELQEHRQKVSESLILGE